MLYLLISGYFHQLVQPIHNNKVLITRKVVITKTRRHLNHKIKIDIVYKRKSLLKTKFLFLLNYYVEK